MRTARKFLLVALVALVAIGAFAASAAPALAANCTVTPNAPYPTMSGPHASGATLPTHLDCTDVVEFQWFDHFSRSNDPGVEYVADCGKQTGCDIYFPSWVSPYPGVGSFTFDTSIYVSCPAPGNKTGWWSHHDHYRIRGYTSGTWGSWHDTPESSGTYWTCVN